MKERYKLALLATMRSFLQNLLIGWVFMVFLMLGLSQYLGLFEENTLTDFVYQIAISPFTLVIPFFVSTVVAALKFNSMNMTKSY